MSIAQMMWVMSEGNPGAMSVLGQMLNDASSVDNIAGGLVDAIMRILLLDGMGVRGSSIWILWKDCSREDMNIFKATLRILQCGGLDLESEIDFNIGDRNLPCAVPYVDPELMVAPHTRSLTSFARFKSQTSARTWPLALRPSRSRRLSSNSVSLRAHPATIFDPH